MDEKLLESPSHTDDPAPKRRRWKWSGIKGKKKWIALVLVVAVAAGGFGAGPSMAYSSTYLLAAVNEFEHDFDK